jgi:hypothetical protein
MALIVKTPKSPLLATKAQLLPHNALRPDVLQLADRLSHLPSDLLNLPNDLLNPLSDHHSLPSGLLNDRPVINR